MTRLAYAVAIAAIASFAALAETAVVVRISSPAVGQPAVDRVDLAVEIEAFGIEVERVDLEIDGRVVHRWDAPPYELTHDFGMSGRSRRIVVRVLGAEGPLAEAARVTPALRIDELVDLELQQIYVTVTDRKGKRVRDLARENFTIRDSDQKQEIVTFGVGQIPFTAMLLVDSSLSMRGRRLEAAQAAARGFVLGMRPLDQAQVVSHSDRVLRVTGVGGRDELTAELSVPFEAVGGTALRDHLYMATRVLESRQGRRTLVLLTDGWDQVSVLSIDKVRAAMRRSQSVLYWVRLAGDEPTSFHMRSLDPAKLREFKAIRYQPPPSSWVDEKLARQNYRGLEELVASTGGRIVVADSIAGMGGAVADVLDELHEQYAIGYYPSPSPGTGRWRPVSVKLNRRGLKVRTREGYVDR
ncbi:MAG: VWA domain-containing protein [Thermoanaerobaculia bacterium]